MVVEVEVVVGAAYGMRCGVGCSSAAFLQLRSLPPPLAAGHLRWRQAGSRFRLAIWKVHLPHVAILFRGSLVCAPHINPSRPSQHPTLCVTLDDTMRS